jgi:trimethylamine--corrinoid protein Co-methyltransferase
MNMMTGVMDYTSYHLPLISAGAAQMAKRYGLPSHTASWGFETKDPGLQSSLSEAFGVMLNTFCGSDMMSGAGSLDNAKGASLEQVVLDSTVWQDIRNYMHRFPVSKDAIALDVVEAVGHAGTFLKNPHTLKNFRTEILVRDQTKRNWQATLSTSMSSETREIAKRVLREHKVPALPADVVKKGDALVKAWERQVGTR